jgi:hypothetical protein
LNKKFQRTIEDFICENCGVEVKGSGYTNHCPRCLWSKHVDINPGDRSEYCKGMMEPVGIEKSGDTFFIVHKCIKCGFKRRNKRNDNDDQEAIMELVSF